MTDITTVKQLEALDEGRVLIDAGGDVTIVMDNSDGYRAYWSAFAGVTRDPSEVDLPVRDLGDKDELAHPTPTGDEAPTEPTEATVERVVHVLNIHQPANRKYPQPEGKYCLCGWSGKTTQARREHVAQAAIAAMGGAKVSAEQCGATWVNEPSEYTDPEYHGAHVCVMPVGHTDMATPTDIRHMSNRGVTFRTTNCAAGLEVTEP